MNRLAAFQGSVGRFRVGGEPRPAGDSRRSTRAHDLSRPRGTVCFYMSPRASSGRLSSAVAAWTRALGQQPDSGAGA